MVSLLAFICLSSLVFPAVAVENAPADGYRGIWYSIKQDKGYGPKYSGGLGTYPANMVPMAVYDEVSGTTFFVYGGTTKSSQTDLQIMIGAFHHDDLTVSRPTTIRDSDGFSDAHANPALTIGGDGHLYVVSATRHRFTGRIYRSLEPRSHRAFEIVHEGYMAYPQIWFHPEIGYTLLHTQYSGNSRFLYSIHSNDGKSWPIKDKAINYARFKGHYQNSGQRPDGSIVTAFNYHPRGVNSRCNIYVMQTLDGGKTWQNISGSSLDIPLKKDPNEALALDTAKRQQLAYIMDLTFDQQNHPVILYITSKHSATGPKGDPREWRTLRWTGTSWDEQIIATSTNNYDAGSIYIEQDAWHVIGPTGTGPQVMMTGGEMIRWTSYDQGKTWSSAALTVDSKQNHTYARRPVPHHPDFMSFWADGDASKRSDSSLYFTNLQGDVFQLPSSMSGDRESPQLLTK